MKIRISYKLNVTSFLLILISNVAFLNFDTVYAGSIQTPINYGDSNGSGSVTISDAKITAQYAIGLPVANFNTAAAQVDGNSIVDIYDAYLIAQYSAGLITQFPVQSQVVNGVCASGNGATGTIPSASNLCISGNASAINGWGPWSWSCEGLNGGSTASCSTNEFTSTAPTFSEEEFVGPFANWMNVKTAFGAKGDGITDDTAAIQNALNALSSTSPTIYFPPGTYLITQTLNMAGQEYVNVIGADPATTTILWGGTSSADMLYINGNAYSRLDRLTFNGQGVAGAAIDQSWTNAGPNFDTSNQYADDIFENVGYGFLCGAKGYGCAETSMLRDKFINNTKAGVFMGNFNALDMWIWYSLFQNDVIGVANYMPAWSGSGGFNVYNSIFEHSTSTDISIGNTMLFNFRNNYSIGSNSFILAVGTDNPSFMTVEGNTVLDTTSSYPIYVGNIGPVLLIDNVFRGLSSMSGWVAQAENWEPSDLFSFNNTFTYCQQGPIGSNPCTVPVTSDGHFHSINDQVVDRNTVNPGPPILPGTPPNNNRTIFEVMPGATASQSTANIQNAITAAAQSSSDKPVVHLQAGSYSINQTLVVPANSDIQIIGDGSYSQLIWAGSGTGPVLQLLGPSQATLSEFEVNGNNYTANGIELDNVDQLGSRVFTQGANLAFSNVNLFVDALDYTHVEMHDLGHYTYTSSGMPSVNVTGGPSAQQGTWLGGMTNIFAGASTGNYIAYQVSNGGHLKVLDTWNDNGGGGIELANASGPSTFTYAGSMGAIPSSDTVDISLNNFTGTAALLNLQLNDQTANIEITGNDTNAQVLGLGLDSATSNFFINTSSPAATTEFLNSSICVSIPGGVSTTELAEIPTTPDTAFLTSTLNQMRTNQPTIPGQLQNGVTDVRFYRVYVDHAINGLHLKAQ